MSGHHGLCPMGQDLAHRPRLDLDEMQPCLCPVIAAVEALVREQVAAESGAPGPCGGCAGMGAHRRWCEKVVGPTAARLGALAEQVDDLGDRVGPADPHACNRLWTVAGELRARAVAAAAKWREDNTHA